ncbi:hypothetical protein PF003_g34618 [Phytophthora fragariae]|nr:hypothetical protein PF003_g34618 [Phytophthora fragariae]
MNGVSADATATAATTTPAVATNPAAAPTGKADGGNSQGTDPTQVTQTTAQTGGYRRRLRA